MSRNTKPCFTHHFCSNLYRIFVAKMHLGTDTELKKTDLFSSFIKKGEQMAVLLDYDGTLAPLASHPSLTVMEPDSEAALKELSTRPNVFLAVISGRAANDVKNKVAIDNITYAGNHGLDILYANGTKFHYEVSAELRSNFTKMVNELEQKVKTENILPVRI